jgi:hypothetical protein
MTCDFLATANTVGHICKNESYMSNRMLIKLSGISGIIGGLLVILTRVVEIGLFGTIPESQKLASENFIIVGILGLLGSLLIVLEISGAYALLCKRFNLWETFAYIMYYIGALLGLGSNWTYAFAVQQMARTSPEYVDAVYPGLLGAGLQYSYGIAFIGMSIVAMIIILRKPLPRWVGVVMILSYLIMLGFGLSHRHLPILTNIMIAAGPIAFGYAVFIDKGE